MSVYAGRTTYLLGSVLGSDTGNLDLDTGGLEFDNLVDSDKFLRVGGNLTVGLGSVESFKKGSDLSASLRYANTQGLTFATVGEGEIRVRDYEDFDFSALNRDVDNVQRVTSRQYIDLEIQASTSPNSQKMCKGQPELCMRRRLMCRIMCGRMALRLLLWLFALASASRRFVLFSSAS